MRVNAGETARFLFSAPDKIVQAAGHPCDSIIKPSTESKTLLRMKPLGEK
jgi:hypothetical protein